MEVMLFEEREGATSGFGLSVLLLFTMMVTIGKTTLCELQRPKSAYQKISNDFYSTTGNQLFEKFTSLIFRELFNL